MRQLLYSMPLALALTAASPPALLAQTAPSGTDSQQEAAPAAPILIADSITTDGAGTLVAEGNVEVLHDGSRLTATRITYVEDDDRLTIDGPIFVTTPDGTVFQAEAARLDRDLRNGLLQGARMVLDRQLQLASAQAERVNGTRTTLARVAVTSCQVCNSTEAPLWEIRANRVLHDSETRQIHFEGAQLRVLDTPVFYLPYLRLPDPTVERARGVLVPRLRSTSQLGLGLELPYFIPIGDHQDVTLTPYISEKSRTLDLRYRRAFARGDMTITSAVSHDRLEGDTLRGYLFAEGSIYLDPTLRLSYNLKTVSDESYLNDYGMSTRDRLASRLSLERVERDQLSYGGLVHYRTLREDENNDTQPSIMADYSRENRLFPGWSRGEWRLALDAHAHYRVSKLDVDGPDDDTIVDGRDLARITGEISWRDRWTLPFGLRFGLSGHLWLDHFSTRQDSTTEDSISQATPGLAAELRWPLIRQGANGGRSLLEPVMQLGWTGGDQPGNANDESTRVEFDEANLLSLSRYPAADRRERGLQAALGLRWQHQRADGWRAGVTLGRVIHLDEQSDFSRSSGLEQELSDWLVAFRLANSAGLALSARGLLDTETRLSKAEARADWETARYWLGASYLLQVTDPDEDRDKAMSEWAFDGAYQVTNEWRASTEWRYDLVDERLDRVGLGLRYTHECVQVDFSAARSYASSTTVEPSTDYSLTVALKGFSTGGSAKENRRTCSN